MITFKKVRFQNIMSYGNEMTEISLNDANATLLVGKNGNGKSAIIEAICFALYNQAFRDIKKGELVNDITGKNCLVELEFNDGSADYLVRRGIKPDVFEVIKNGELQNQKAKAVDYQKVLENEILRCKFKAFCQIVILGSAAYTPFMKLPTPKRKEIVEDLLDLNVYSSMTALIKGWISDLGRDVSETNLKIKSTKDKIEILLQAQNEVAALQGDILRDLTERRGACSERLSIVTEAIKALEACDHVFDDKTYNALRTKGRDLSQALGEVRVKYTEQEKEITFYLNDTCPTCKQAIDDRFRKTALESRRKKLDDLSSLKDKLRSSHDKVHDKIVDLEELRDQTIAHHHEIERKHDERRRIEKDIADIDASIFKHKLKASKDSATPVNSADVAGLQTELEGHYKTLEAQESSLKHHRACLVSLPIIKGQEIKKFVPKFNHQIKWYMNKFQFPIRFEIDENFEETMMIRGKTDKGYNSLSEGQKFRINLALLFAWRAVAKDRNSINTNLIIFDELFDGPCDDDGKEHVVDIIKNVLKDTNTIVISHAMTERDGFDRKLEVHKKGNFAKLVQA